MPIASVTKLMTSMVALDTRAPMSRPLRVSAQDRDYEKFTGSRLKVGSVLSRRDMLHIALMSSENRAAAALSRDYPGGRPAFVAAMNRKARTLGMKRTHFVNATGLSPRNVSTARDLSRLVAAASRYPRIKTFSTATSKTVFPGRGQLRYVNSDALVRAGDSSIVLQKNGLHQRSGPLRGAALRGARAAGRHRAARRAGAARPCRRCGKDPPLAHVLDAVTPQQRNRRRGAGAIRARHVAPRPRRIAASRRAAYFSTARATSFDPYHNR
ncbi:D-alanyl-D-alanine carboxypeptidase family protein [Burkholderia pseudomallei MSHR1000]|nr:D-alanyl-D-alanine carboxypeptidase family protein [Burkholderia pseudomallei MSHR1000]